MRIEEAGSIAVAAGDRKQTVHLYAMTGGGLEPGYLWLDADRNLFAS